MSQKILSELMTLVMAFVMLALVVETSPVPSEYGEHNNPYYSELEKVPANILIELMARFGQTMIRARNDLENSKRAVDFGLARGYSGTQEAKHRMGLAAANFPGGPGRRRRSDNET